MQQRILQYFIKQEQQAWVAVCLSFKQVFARFTQEGDMLTEVVHAWHGVTEVKQYVTDSFAWKILYSCKTVKWNLEKYEQAARISYLKVKKLIKI